MQEPNVESDDDDNKSTRISLRHKRPPAAFKARPENSIAERKANLLKQYNSDKEYSDNRNSILDIAITKRFYEDYHANQKALYSAFYTAVSSTTSQSNNVPKN